MNILEQLKELFTSPRFISFYWSFGAMAVPGILAIMSGLIKELNAPEIVMVVFGLMVAQITKALNNKANDKPMGFAK